LMNCLACDGVELRLGASKHSTACGFATNYELHPTLFTSSIGMFGLLPSSVPTRYLSGVVCASAALRECFSVIPVPYQFQILPYRKTKISLSLGVNGRVFLRTRWKDENSIPYWREVPFLVGGFLEDS
jgi:hypothetical protein